MYIYEACITSGGRGGKEAGEEEGTPVKSQPLTSCRERESPSPVLICPSIRVLRTRTVPRNRTVVTTKNGPSRPTCAGGFRSLFTVVELFPGCIGLHASSTQRKKRLLIRRCLPRLYRTTNRLILRCTELKTSTQPHTIQTKTGVRSSRFAPCTLRLAAVMQVHDLAQFGQKAVVGAHNCF